MDANSFDNDAPTRKGSEEEEGPPTPQDQRLGRALKRFKTVMERTVERELLLQKLEDEYGKMRAESGDDRDFPPLLRAEDEDVPGAWHRRLPQDVINQVWLRVIEDGVGRDAVESSVFDVEVLASGLAPDRPLPQDPRLREVERQMALLKRPDGAYAVERAGDLDVLLPGPEWGDDIEDRPRRKYQALSAERMELLAMQTSEKYLLQRRRGLAGIPELATVLATANTLWRRWWHRDFPRHVLEYGSSAWAEEWVETPAYLHPSSEGPRPPSWILKMQARQGLSDAEAGVEAQYAHCAWRRFHAWTLFFERRCYRLIMDIAEARANEYAVTRPRYTPHGVYWAEPLIPDDWMLQSAEEKSMADPGESYTAFARYNSEGNNNNDDIDRAMDLDRIALLLPETDMRDEANDSLLSAGVLAYIALSHAGQGADHETLNDPFREFASIRLANGSSQSAWVYNFLGDPNMGPFAPNEQRQDRYRNILLSYILWSVVTAQRRERLGPPYPLAETLVDVRERATDARLPVRRNLFDPLEQATVLGLYRPSGQEAEGVEGSWAFLNLLPVVPMRGLHRSTNRITGHGGVRFVGEANNSAKNFVV